ncbi:MAG: sulfotransferase, partial [Hydrogenophilaceae bacterium]
VTRLQQGDAVGADRLIDQALALAPTNATLLGIKGMALHGRGRHEAAVQYITRALAINPADSRLHNFHGQVLADRPINANRVAAERAFAKAASLDPSFVEAWCNLGALQMLMDKPHEAVHSYAEALRLAPKDSDVRINLAKAHYLNRELEQAAGLLGQIEARGSEQVRLTLMRSLITRAQGQADAAEALIQQALTETTDSAVLGPLLLDLGQTEMKAGNMAEAERWLRQAISTDPIDAAPYLDLAAAHKFNPDDAGLIRRMEQFLTEDAALQRRMGFALGKIYSDLADYDRSFARYKAANDSVRKQVSFNPVTLQDQASKLIECYSAERLDGLAAGSDSNLPILIVGTPRSGTTLTEQIISSHSQVAGAGEMDFWGRLGPTTMESYDPELARQLAAGYLALMRQHSDSAAHIIDKQPLNFLNIGAIHAVFPNARIVHCRRHPIDACLSIYFQDFDDSQAYKWDLDGLVVFYEQYQRLMAHWRAVLPPGTLYDLQYEALVDDVEGESKKLMTFLGLDWEPGQLDFHKQERTVFTPSKWQVRQPIYKTSKDRWRRYEKHLGPLLDLLKYAQ